MDDEVKLYIPDTVERIKGVYLAAFDIVDPALAEDFPQLQKGEPILHII